MGQFLVEISAVGGHGCDRTAKQGQPISSCGRMGCPDCEAKRFLGQLHQTMPEATLKVTHWPGQPDEVVDEYKRAPEGPYVVGTRVKGSFGP
jgi:hypothetical protein